MILSLKLSSIVIHVGVDNGPVWVGMGPKPETDPNLEWRVVVHTKPFLRSGFAGFG
jgi:hypothetical protein